MSYEEKLNLEGTACQVENGSINSVEATVTDTSDTEEIANSAQFARIAQPLKDGGGDDGEIDLFNTPLIPEVVYDNLPDLLKRNSEVFDRAREKDVFLTGALTILSGCLNTVDGVYDEREFYANLNCFIVAPPASGKGVFVYARMLGEAYHEKLVQESELIRKQYQVQLSKNVSNDSTSSAVVKKPPFKILFIPGNASSSAIIQHLVEGEGKGIFCETEADTLTGSIKQDWGNFSDLLRKAFQHENVSITRKTNSEYNEIKRPRLSVALSGTPNQVEGLIPSAEDGLFSRFIFYSFSSRSEWRSVAPGKKRRNLNAYFEGQSVEVLKMIEYLDANPSTFDLTEDQWNQLDQQFETWLLNVNQSIGGDAESSIKRLGLILFRLAMVLTSIRKYEEKSKKHSLVCSDIDFKIAMQLVEVYKEHSLHMFNRLPQTGGLSDRMVRQFYNELPKAFPRRQALTIGIKDGIETRTVDKYLRVLVSSKKLEQPKFGSYIKK